METTADAFQFEPPPTVEDSDEQSYYQADVLSLDQSVNASARVGIYRASGGLTTTINTGPMGIESSGTSDSGVFPFDEPNGGGDATALLNYRASFRLDVESSYAIAGQLLADGPFLGPGTILAGVWLEDDAGNVLVEITHDAINYPHLIRPIDVEGTLGPGTYHLRTAAETTSGSGSGEGDYDIVLSLVGSTLPGDLNGDGLVDAMDAEILFSGWGTIPPGDPIADTNGDGLVDAADASVVFTNWTGDSLGAQSVPEPGSIAGVLLVGAIGWLLLRRP